MSASAPGPGQAARTGTALSVAALVLASLTPLTAPAEEQAGVGANSNGINANTTPLGMTPPFRAVAIREPSSPRPPRDPAAGTLLIAQHKLQDPNFLRSVVLLAEYSAEGALGLILNRPTTVSLADALAEVEKLRGRPERLYAGGPVQRNRIFLLIESQQPPGDALPIIRNLYLSANVETLEKLLDGSNPGRRFRAYAGYAGWGPGQLDGELERGDWQLWWGHRDAVFSDEDVDLWQRLISESTQRWVRWHPGLKGWLPVSRSSAGLVPILAKLAPVYGSINLEVRERTSRHRVLR